MWYPLTVTEAAASEPIGLDTAKLRCRIDSGDEDEDVAALIAAARSHVEAYTGLRLMQQTVTAKCDSFDDLASLPFGPVQSVSSVAYVDSDGNAATLATSVYEARVDGLQAGMVLKYGQTWPSIQIGSRITVTAVLGYSTIPEAITQAMFYIIADWYENREKLMTGTRAAAVDMPGSSAFDALLSNFRLGI